MLSATNLFAEVDDHDHDAIARDLHAAILRGGELTGTDAEAERTRGSHALMCAAGELLTEVALVSQVFERELLRRPAPTDTELREPSERLRDTSAAAARLLWRALEAHPRNTYQLDAGRDGVARVAGAVLSGDSERLGLPPRGPVTIARGAVGELFDALSCEPDDPAMVPVHLATSLGYVVSLYMLATTLTGRTMSVL
ncbi:hypothetical protein [Conexibacter woesei]|uniref:Uncharacterized protein n=1 Tax=Conexibacter woesei (strain DSM 14684 / CCUG 47730 / CIP 108061 / JCM 11494 / NBRC 100937 / ID131577) TaxID=469383 RepID=D3F9X9_CONWI|nr:hypothetical protein [Conexibacter woesei]ADB53074.1 hypothetical protein Cwoe_4661 [Conexibacter woesei DSM 14684]